MRAYTSAQSKALDLAAQAQGVAGFELMRRAGMAAFQQIGQRFPGANTLFVLAGKGNNGGDAWVVAGAAHAAGWRVHLWSPATDPARLTGEAGLARDWALSRGLASQLTDRSGFDALLAQAPSVASASGTDHAFNAGAVVVDGLLGTGLKSAPRADVSQAIDWINHSGLDCVALDLPSGLNADNGAAPGSVVDATLTISFIAMKLGLVTGQGPDRAGLVVLEPLGLDVGRLPGSEAGCECFGLPVPPLPARRASAYKNEFGHVVVLGGDQGGGGAAIMAAEAAMRTGAGLVSVGTREQHVAPLLARRPEIMARAIEGKLAAVEFLQRSSVVVVGPGLGQHAWGAQLYAAVVDAMADTGLAENADLPATKRVAVIDADALNLVAAGAPLPKRSVITPHPGEAARLLGCDKKSIEIDRIGAVEELAAKYSCIAVLKGAGTLIANREGLVAVCTLGNPGMATAGMGDTLAGIIAAVIAQQSLTARWVARAVQLHAAAGDRAAQRLSQPSLLAGDLLAELPDLLRADG